MPIYEYRCDVCGQAVSVKRAVDDRDLPLTCGGPNCVRPPHMMTRIISAPNFQLKGGGWYVTDFKGKSQDGDNGSGSPT